MKNKLIVPALVVVMGGVAAIATPASAHGWFISGTENPHQPLIQKLVQKFGLKEDEVKAVFDEVKVAHKTEMKANLEKKLTIDVAAGKITEAQKQAILAKMEEIHSQHLIDKEAFQDMTPEQRREAMTKVKNDLKAWATANNIDPSYLNFGRMKVRMK